MFKKIYLKKKLYTNINLKYKKEKKNIIIKKKPKFAPLFIFYFFIIIFWNFTLI